MDDKTNAVAPGSQSFVVSHPFITVAVILGCILLLFLLIRMFYAIRQKRQKTVEVASLKKDLMIWSRLSSLVRGGGYTDKAKLELNNKISTIDSMFADCKNLLSSTNYMARFPRTWHIIVGEPNCGKSSLLEKSELEFKASYAEGKIKPPVKFYVNSSEVIVDVSGKVFFDNWVGGSSAEWAYICKKLRRANRKKPLDSIIITISAESLLADDKELTLKKSHLMVGELMRMTSTLRMNLPCYVVISKLDTILGFRDYFAEIPGEVSKQIVGYQPSINDGFYHEDDFERGFNALVDRIKDGCTRLFLGKDVIRLTSENASRMPLCGNIFLFADCLNEVRENLKLYLETLFGIDALKGQSILIFKGVYFTSAEDKGYCLNKRFAEVQNSTLDNSPMVETRTVNNRPYFIHSLLSKMAFGSKMDAQFTKQEYFLRLVPYYSFCAIMLFVSSVYWYGTIVKGPELQKNLEDDTLYYSSLESSIKNGIINSAPLFSLNQSGDVLLSFDWTMPNDPSTSRLNFFTQLQKRITRGKSIPWEFMPHSMLYFGWDNVLDLDGSFMIYNQVQSKMAFLPMVRIVEDKMLNTSTQPFDEQKTQALLSLVSISLYDVENRSAFKNTAYSSNVMQSFVLWAIPNINEDMSKKVRYFLPDYDYMSYVTNSNIVLDERYTDACRNGIEGLVKNWGELKNYPKHDFNLVSRYVDDAIAMINSYEELDDYSSLDLKTIDYESIKSLVYNCRTSISTFISKSYFVDELFKFTSPKANNSVKGEAAKMVSAVAASLSDMNKGPNAEQNNNFQQVDLVYRNLVGFLHRDFDALDEYDKMRSHSDSYYDHMGSVHFGSLDFSAFPEVRDRAERLLKDRYDKVKESLVKINQMPVFRHVDPKDHESAYNFEVLRDVLAAARLSVVTSNTQNWTLVDLKNNSLRLDSEYTHNMDDLKNILEHNKNNEIVTKWVTKAQRILKADYSLQYLELTKFVEKYYPFATSDSKMLADLTVSIAKQNPDKKKFIQEYSAAGDGLGNLNIREEYDPDSFNYFLQPLVLIKRVLTSEDESYAYAKNILKNSERLKRIMDVFSSYLSGYMKYWSNLPDTVHIEANSYADFYNHMLNMRSYQINDKLQTLYNKSYEVIDNIDPIMLSKGDVERRKQYLDKLNARRSLINIDYIDLCNETLTEWDLLTADATYANRLVMQMKPSEVNDKLLSLLKPSKSENYIPWWSNFTDLGVKLLKRDASKEASLSLMQFQSELKVFPIVKDADPHKRILSKNDIRSLLVLFKSFGLSDTSSEKSEDALAAFANNQNELKAENGIQTPLIFSPVSEKQSNFKVWASSISQMLNLLSGSGKDMQFKLGLVDAADQQRLIVAQNLGTKLSIARYRYFDIQIGDGKTSQKMPSFVSGKMASVVVTAPIDNKEIIFRFYRYSDSKDPDCQVVIDGSYPALQLYLNESGEYNEETKSTFVPIVLNEQNGESSIFFLSLGVVGKLPTPEQWPSSDDWPSADSFSSN